METANLFFFWKGILVYEHATEKAHFMVHAFLKMGLAHGWQLVINTGTTIITFLMVFLIQNMQNRDTQALQIKLDGEELDLIRKIYLELARKAREALRRGRPDTGVPKL